MGNRLGYLVSFPPDRQRNCMRFSFDFMQDDLFRPINQLTLNFVRLFCYLFMILLAEFNGPCSSFGSILTSDSKRETSIPLSIGIAFGLSFKL